MTSKKLFARRSKRETSEPYHRTGGLLPIDTTVANDSSIEPELKTTPNAGRRRAPNLKIETLDPQQFTSSPLSPQHNAALVSSVSCLRAVFSDILRSPTSNTTACPKSASTHTLLPVLPRPVSLPLVPDIPAELAGSTLLDDQVFTHGLGLGISTSTRPISHNFRLETLPFEQSSHDHEDLSALLRLFPQPRSLEESSPEPEIQHGTMKSSCDSNILESTNVAESVPLKAHQKQCWTQIDSQRRSHHSLMKSPSFLDMKGPLSICGESNLGPSKGQIDASRLSQSSPIGVSTSHGENTSHLDSRHFDAGASTPTPTSHSKQIGELKATIATQDETMFILQAQFGSMRASHEAHIAKFVEMQAAEVASLKNYARVLEEQLSQRPFLHHAASTDLLFLLETVESQSPTRNRSRRNPDSGPSPNTLGQGQPLPQHLQSSAEMEKLKRRLSTSRWPDTAPRNLLPELNQYKQNNVALQKQIESLMAKLNDSKKSEKALRESLEDSEYRCTQWQDQAVRADKIAKSAKGMQNNINNLEKRLETANIGKLEAEKQLLNLQAQHASIETSEPRQSSATESATLDTFIEHIERLEDIIRQQDAHISALEGDVDELRQRYIQLEQENSATNLQLDIQNDLISKTKETDAHIEQLRTAIVDRESVIDEKEKSIRLVERQLEHHQLLLQAEIRKHAKMTIHAAVNDEPLPELSTLAEKEEIDRWIDKLHQRLKKEKPLAKGPAPVSALDAQVEDLRQEVDFYVREIIYYKLDIRGYKSDIKRLKRITNQLSTYGCRASDLESDTSSLRPTPTPSQMRFPSVSDASSSAPLGYFPPFAPRDYPATPPLSASTFSSSRSMNPKKSTGRHASQQLDRNDPSTPRTPHRKTASHAAAGSRDTDTGISPRSVARPSSDRRKPTPPSPDREKFGDMLTEFPLSTPASPKRCDAKRGASDSVVRLDTMCNMVEMGSVGEGETSPSRPPRQPCSLFGSPPVVHQATQYRLSSSPRANTLGGTFQKSSDRTFQSTLGHSLFTLSTVRNPPTQDARAPSAVSNFPLQPQQPSKPSQSLQPLQGKPSTEPTPTFPFVISTGTSHNPALNLLVSTTSLSPTTCSITRYCSIGRKCAPLNSTPRNLESGAGETVASTATLISPAETRLSEEEGVSSLKSNFPNGDAPRTPSQARKGSVESVESVVTAIRLSKRESMAVEDEVGHTGSIRSLELKEGL